MCSINMIFNFGRYAGGSICKIQTAPPYSRVALRALYRAARRHPSNIFVMI